MKTSLKKYLAVVTRGDYKVPSRVYAVKASTAAVAVKRALLKAQAEYPRYKNFDITVDTITPRKIKRFNRVFMPALRDTLAKAEADYQYHSKKAAKLLNELVNQSVETPTEIMRGWVLMEVNTRAEVQKLQLRNLCRHIKRRNEGDVARQAILEQWLQLIELNDTINAE